MALKDEIDNLIKAKRAELDKKEAESKLALDRREQNFAPMIELLKEIVASDPQHIDAGYYFFMARISVGEPDNRGFKHEYTWEIIGNDTRDAEARDLEDAPGFQIIETCWLRLFERDSERVFVLPDESAVASYLVDKITDCIAKYKQTPTAGR